jgi:ribonuclease R
MTDDYYRFDEGAHRLEGRNTGKAHRLGDRVSVQVARVDLERRQVDFALASVLERAKGDSGPGRGRQDGGRRGRSGPGRSRPTKPSRGARRHTRPK